MTDTDAAIKDARMKLEIATELMNYLHNPFQPTRLDLATRYLVSAYTEGTEE